MTACIRPAAQRPPRYPHGSARAVSAGRGAVARCSLALADIAAQHCGQQNCDHTVPGVSVMRKHLPALALASVSTLALAAPFQNGSFETGTLNNTGSFDTLANRLHRNYRLTVIGDGIDYGGGSTAAAGSRSIDTLSCGVSGGVSQTSTPLPAALTWSVLPWPATRTAASRRWWFQPPAPLQTSRSTRRAAAAPIWAGPPSALPSSPRAVQTTPSLLGGVQGWRQQLCGRGD